MPHGAILNVTSLRNTFQQPTRALKIVKTSSNDLFIIPQPRGKSKSTDPISSSICFPFDLSMNLKRPIYASRDRYFRNFRRFERSYERFEDRSRLEEQEAAGSRSGWHASGGSHLKRAKISQDNRFLSFSLPLTDFRQFRLEPPLSLSSRVDSGSKRRSIHLLLSFRLGEIGERRENAVLDACVDRLNFFDANIRVFFFSKRDGGSWKMRAVCATRGDKRIFVGEFKGWRRSV